MKLYKPALAFLIGMSLWFYGYNNIYYLAILIVSILLNFGIVTFMSRFQDKGKRRLCLFAGIIINIGILFYFKYYDFFIENVNAILKTDKSLLHLALPLGISFYTFQQLSYIIDAYKKDCEHYSFIEYAAYVSFFPQLIAGPIVYHSELIPQFRDLKNKRLKFDNLSRGLYAFALGLAKKVLLADTLSKIVAVGYNNIAELNSVSALLVMICYSLQIYFDFSGYCDMAYGMAYMLNIKLPFNFNSPYKAESINDFWDRWHMTLTRFFTKYIYIPLGGNRKGTIRTYVNIMIVFLVSGLWHGANWTFILWGAIHGIMSVLERILQVSKWKVPKIIKIGITFLLVTFAWSLFRADSLSQAGALWHQLIYGGLGPVYRPVLDVFNDLLEISFLRRFGFESLIFDYRFLPLLSFAGLLLIICFATKNTQEQTAGLKFSAKELLTVVVLMLWSIMSLSEISEFLYFNF
ncbi:MAG: MBOAT family O-acyltransferase [Suilimivivens sp.]